MAEIRLLDAKFKDILKRTDTNLNEFVEAVKTKKETLINVNGVNLVKNHQELELFVMSAFRKHKELRIKLLAMVNVGTFARNEFEHLHNFEQFLQYIFNSFLECIERCRMVSSVIMPHQFVVLENHLKYNIAQGF
ncbi:hypothetical protein FF38_14526 [Lucilia cuprina]|uniref:Uncharacterized protein n=1 Tax=Lucilia cuprina TaxID=7375 RepID=A0A0L0CA67_LUCCU|nr:hypothetical protein FF38_14526 [Lucilia cuprina]